MLFFVFALLIEFTESVMMIVSICSTERFGGRVWTAISINMYVYVQYAVYSSVYSNSALQRTWLEAEYDGPLKYNLYIECSCPTVLGTFNRLLGIQQ